MIPYAVLATALIPAAVIVAIWLFDTRKLREKQTSGRILALMHRPGMVHRQEQVRMPSWSMYIQTDFGGQWMQVPRHHFKQMSINHVGIVWYTRTRLSKRISINRFQVDR